MIITKTASELTKRYAAGASCEIHFENIEKTMFWPHYENLAKETNEINRDVVRKYWFKVHNRIVLELLLKRKYTLEKAKSCLVYPGIVRKILEEKLLVAYQPLIKKNGLDLSMRETLVKINKESLEAEEGNIISFHGEAVAEIITKDEAAFLTNKTRETIDLLNKGGK